MPKRQDDRFNSLQEVGFISTSQVGSGYRLISRTVSIPYRK